MKKQLFITTVILSILGTVSYAAMPTEKDIGPCTAKNSMGFCSQSKTHYCAQFGSNGRCLVWYSKSKSTYDNAVNQINSFNEDINKAVEKQNKIDKPINDKIKQEFPILDEVTNTRIKYEEEMNQLSRKRNLGVTVDEKRIRLLYYKTNILKEMEGYYTLLNWSNIPEGDTLKCALGIKNDYKSLVNSLNSNVLNESEFNEAKSKVVKAYDTLVSLYNKLIALNTEPDIPWQSWISKTYSETYCKTELVLPNFLKDKLNTSESKGIKAIKNFLEL